LYERKARSWSTNGAHTPQQHLALGGGQRHVRVALEHLHRRQLVGDLGVLAGGPQRQLPRLLQHPPESLEVLVGRHRLVDRHMAGSQGQQEKTRQQAGQQHGGKPVPAKRLEVATA